MHVPNVSTCGYLQEKLNGQRKFNDKDDVFKNGDYLCPRVTIYNIYTYKSQSSSLLRFAAGCYWVCDTKFHINNHIIIKNIDIGTVWCCGSAVLVYLYMPSFRSYEEKNDENEILFIFFFSNCSRPTLYIIIIMETPIHIFFINVKTKSGLPDYIHLRWYYNMRDWKRDSRIFGFSPFT